MFKRFVEKFRNNGTGEIPLFCPESSEFFIPLFGPTTVPSKDSYTMAGAKAMKLVLNEELTITLSSSWSKMMASCQTMRSSIQLYGST